MRCIVKKISAVFLATAVFQLSGCGQEIEFEQKYDIFNTTESYGIGTFTQEQDLSSFFGEELCVGGTVNSSDEAVTEDISEACGLFGLQNREILYSRNIYEKLYPASTTKIMTAYVALKYGDLSQTATVSETALDLEEGSSVCNLSVGDTLTLEQLLYGLMLKSGNDAANVIAEMISGNTESFAALMNQEALALGATNSHFVNPHGLHNEDHYTTVYDLYLIFRSAVADERFLQIIGTDTYQAQYQNSQGEDVVREWTNSNRYLTGEEEAPEGITVIGGKTGTTDEAGNCLVLYSNDSQQNSYVSIVLKGDGRENLYLQMTELLKKILN